MEKKMIITALVCGLLCAACLFGYVMLLQRQAEAQRLQVLEQYGGEQVEVLVATTDIQPGETLDATNSKKELWVSNLLPEGSVTDTSDMWGKKATSLILSGEVVSSKRFEGENSAVEIPEGFVAISVPAKDVQAVGGRVASGNKVDVYAVGTKTSCLGTDILVLETSAKSQDEQSQTKVEWVTLAVKPESVQEYIAASEDLEIYLALPASQADSASKDESLSADSFESDSSQAKDKQSSTEAKDSNAEKTESKEDSAQDSVSKSEAEQKQSDTQKQANSTKAKSK